MTRSREIPRMTAGRAALVRLMDRYLHGSLDPVVTLLEVHKLMYFMQAAGEPLQLRYTKSNYGPYADNLRHVRNTVERHFIAGYADGEDAPDKPLEIVPGAIKDAAAVLARSQETRQRCDRVAALDDGFESSFGLKLLSTVHWIFEHDDPDSRNDLEMQTYAWNERRKRVSPRQIGLAADVLTEKGWVDG